MEIDKNKINLAVSLISNNYEETKTIECSIILVNNEVCIVIPLDFLKDEMEKIKNNEVGLIIKNLFIEKLVDKENAMEWIDFIYLKSGTKLVKVFFDNILYIITSGDYTITFTIDNNQYHTNNRLNWFETKLPPEYFLAVHGSHIINMRCIKKFIDNKRTGIVIMIDLAELGISQRKKEAFDEMYLKFDISIT